MAIRCAGRDRFATRQRRLRSADFPNRNGDKEVLVGCRGSG